MNMGFRCFLRGESYGSPFFVTYVWVLRLKVIFYKEIVFMTEYGF